MPALPRLPANGAAIPVIGFGTFRLQGDPCRRAVAAALASGYRHIDTAAMYDNEAEVGEGARRLPASPGAKFSSPPKSGVPTSAPARCNDQRSAASPSWGSRKSICF